MQETQVRSLGQEDPLEKEMATHSSALAWRIPWTEEPGGLQSVGSLSQTRLSDFTFFHFGLGTVDMALPGRSSVWWAGQGETRPAKVSLYQAPVVRPEGRAGFARTS